MLNAAVKAAAQNQVMQRECSESVLPTLASRESTSEAQFEEARAGLSASSSTAQLGSRLSHSIARPFIGTTKTSPDTVHRETSPIRPALPATTLGLSNGADSPPFSPCFNSRSGAIEGPKPQSGRLGTAASAPAFQSPRRAHASAPAAPSAPVNVAAVMVTPSAEVPNFLASARLSARTQGASYVGVGLRSPP